MPKREKWATTPTPQACLPGLPISVFDGLRAALAANRPQFYNDITLPFYGYNRRGAKISEGIH
jgi:hypothetical protein